MGLGASLYLVEMTSRHTQETFHKIGISKNVYSRFLEEKTYTPSSHTPLDYMEHFETIDILSSIRYPYKIKLIKIIDFKYRGAAAIVEKYALDQLKAQSYKPQINISGRTECFELVGVTAKQIRIFMDQALANAGMIEPERSDYDEAAKSVSETDEFHRHVKILGLIREKKLGRTLP